MRTLCTQNYYIITLLCIVINSPRARAPMYVSVPDKPLYAPVDAYYLFKSDYTLSKSDGAIVTATTSKSLYMKTALRF